MITLYLGAYGHGKSTEIIENIKKDFVNKTRSFLIVPEQQTLVSERQLTIALPPSAQLYTEATNLTRLANSVFRKTGGLKYNYVTKSKKNLIMYRTICEVRGLLKHYNKIPVGREKSYIGMFLQAIGELKSYSVTIPLLDKALSELEQGASEETELLRAKVQDILTANGIAFTIDPMIVRGLDYYTRTVFEFVSNGLTLCGGGRYDNLVEEVGGKPTGAVGFGLGIERLMMILERQNGAIEEMPERDVYIGSMGDAGLLKAQSLAYALRKAGIKADCDTVERSVKAQMKYANKIGAKYSVILGDSEIESGKVELKEMATSEKTEIALADLVSIMQKKCVK